MKKILIAIMIVTVVVIGTIYGIMVYDTNEVITDFENIISQNEVSDDVKNSELYRRYSHTHRYEDIKYAEVSVERDWVKHNFQEGYMNVQFTYMTYDINHELINGARGIYAKWYIKKENEQWIVYKIEEQP